MHMRCVGRYTNLPWARSQEEIGKEHCLSELFGSHGDWSLVSLSVSSLEIVKFLSRV